MASRLKRLVRRNRKGQAPAGENAAYSPSLTSLPYHTTPPGNAPLVGERPIYGSTGRTSSTLTPEDSGRKRRSKRFSQSSFLSFRSQPQGIEPDGEFGQQYEGIPHADALYESSAQPSWIRSIRLPRGSRSAVSLPQREQASSRRGEQRASRRTSTATEEGSWSGTGQKAPNQALTQDVRQATPDPQTIIDRAHFDTEDVGTAVTIAPAVTHEVIHHQIHHVREEQITREIHDHDIYHRMLPVVDVEVLPARHFLPTEGGGLAEIDAKEAPGRGKHWIIAETASTIPSHQSVSLEPRKFTARKFAGTEGDARRYRAPEGHLITEQTWVHPPTMETGARDTGQSWPLEMESLSIQDQRRPKSAERKARGRKSIERKSVPPRR